MQTILSATAALLLLTSAQTSLGQTMPTAPADTAHTYQHHLGLTGSPQLDQFFTANRSLPIGLLYRQQTQPNRAWRARLVGRYDFRSGDAPLQIGSAYREHTGSAEIAWGRERWLPLSRRFTAYAGAEVGARLEWYRKNSEEYRALPRYVPIYSPLLETAVGEVLETRNTQFVFLQAFAGLRFQINKRLCAEAEAGLPISFSHQQWKLNAVEYYVIDQIPTGATTTGNNTYYSVSAQLHPINRLHLIFLF